MKFYICNSFTNIAFEGNPAGVVFDDECTLSDTIMQKIAAQLNLVETVFVLPSSDRQYAFQMRYFTPFKELPMAGHPTLAAWHVLLKQNKVSEQGQYKVLTAGGVIDIEKRDRSIFLSQKKPSFMTINQSEKDDVLSVFSLKLSDLLEFPIVGVNSGLGHLVFGVKTLDTLMNMKFDINSLKGLCERYGLREAQIFCPEVFKSQNTIHTRNFCPRHGLEDPACGNGNAALGAYYMKYVESESSHIAINVEQGHIVEKPALIEVSGRKIAKDSYDIQIGGNAVLMAEGHFYL